ncbi:MAG: hypothetical protein ACRDBI_04175, partial [Shewanella sp.]
GAELVEGLSAWLVIGAHRPSKSWLFSVPFLSTFSQCILSALFSALFSVPRVNRSAEVHRQAAHLPIEFMLSVAG